MARRLFDMIDIVDNAARWVMRRGLLEPPDR